MKRKIIFFTSGLSIFCGMSLLFLTSCEEKKCDGTGVFEAPSVIVSAETSGKIFTLNVNEGDVVEPGQELALIDTILLGIQYRELCACHKTAVSVKTNDKVQTEALHIQLRQLQTDQKRIANLLKAGASTQQQKDDIDSRIMVVESQIKALEETIDHTNTSTEGKAEDIDIQKESVLDMLRRCHVTAPIHGTVITKYCEAGEVTAAGHPLLKIADMDRIYLRAYFTGDKMTQLKISQKVTVRTLFGGNERQYEGTVTWISSESEFTPKSIPTEDERSNLTYAVKIAVKNDGYIKTGLNGEVWI